MCNVWSFKSSEICRILILGVVLRAGHVGGSTLKSVELTVRNLLRTNIDLEAKV